MALDTNLSRPELSAIGNQPKNKARVEVTSEFGQAIGQNLITSPERSRLRLQHYDKNPSLATEFSSPCRVHLNG
jgi:hypothetical protein